MAPKMILTKEDVHELVSDNRYEVDPTKKYISRCIDGRYDNAPDLPALSLAGADAGELAVILAAANTYGFSLDEKKFLQSLLDIIGGAKHFSFHTDTHASTDMPTAGDEHMKQIRLDPGAYGLDKDQIEAILKMIVEVQKEGAVEIILQGDHVEGAVLQVEGQWGIYPKFKIETTEGSAVAQVFVYHKTLVDERHKILAKKLIENKAVVLYDGLDEVYLAHVLSETAETHLFETLRRLAQGLPLYNIVIKDNGEYQVDEMGSV